MKDELDIFRLASGVFPEFARVTLELSNERKSPILGWIGSSLMIAHWDDYSHQWNQSFRVQLEDILVLLGNLYMEQRQTPPQSGRSVLRELSEVGNGLGPATNALRSKLTAYEKNHSNARQKRDHSALSEHPFTRLQEAIGKLNKFLEPEKAERKKPVADPDGYPAAVNEELYRILKKTVECRCEPACVDSRSQRLIRLCLKLRLLMQEQDVLFDMLFSGSLGKAPEKFGHWQQVRFGLPSKKSHPKGRVAFADDPAIPQKLPTNQSTFIKVQNFCHLLDENHGPIWVRVKIENGEVFKFSSTDDAGEAGELVEACESISLSRVLQSYQLTGKMKLVLAYILAYSIWRYYNSDWMKARWSVNSIHFVKEEDLDIPGGIYACKPCFAVQFQLPTNDVEEISDDVVVHKYPRLLALGILLFNIGRQRSLPNHTGSSPDNMIQQINDDYARATCSLKRDHNWPHLGRLHTSIQKRYREITNACFDKKLFMPDQSATSQSSQIKGKCRNLHDAENRRAILYKQIVAPLGGLLEDLGWKEALEEIDPMEARPPETPVNSSISGTEALQTNNFLGARTLGSSSDTSPYDKSRAWLQQVQELYYEVMKQYRNQVQKEAYPRIRIAVLDTGYNPNTEFFLDRDRQRRLRGWKDWAVESSAYPRDDNGHGSHVLSLLMKMAPMADMYVARIAKNSAQLERSSQSIADAITWAANECKVNIVCMSFGFAKEEEVGGQLPLRKAIHQAYMDRSNKILFFSAAGNEGANLQKVMFPARHDLVIPVYGTDDKGAFLEGLNPRMKPDGPAIFGTLAKDVPCSSHVEGKEVHMTGTSFATGIAAGLAGTLLQYVQLLEERKQGNQHRLRDQLSTRLGMIAMFQNIAEQPPDRRYYIHPMHFFQKSDEAKEASIIIAVDSLN